MTPTERLNEIGREIRNLSFKDDNIFKLNRYYDEAIKICIDNKFTQTAIQIGVSKKGSIDLMYMQKTEKNKEATFKKAISELSADLTIIS